MASENESVNGFYINSSRSGEKISYGRFVVLKWITLYIVGEFGIVCVSDSP